MSEFCAVGDCLIEAPHHHETTGGVRYDTSTGLSFPAVPGQTKPHGCCVIAAVHGMPCSGELPELATLRLRCTELALAVTESAALLAAATARAEKAEAHAAWQDEALTKQVAAMSARDVELRTALDGCAAALAAREAECERMGKIIKQYQSVIYEPAAGEADRLRAECGLRGLLREWDEPGACGCETFSCTGLCLPARTRLALGRKGKPVEPPNLILEDGQP